MKKILTALFVAMMTLCASPAVLAHKAGTDESPDTLNSAGVQEKEAGMDQQQANQDRAASSASGNTTESYLLQQQADQEQKKADSLKESARDEQNLSDDVNSDQ
ncbi:hypothetical protein F9C28_10735 [Shimwellia pseudoproteus]|uniref:hypothetical protein n=1 Tax=Shimwellia pseudoproteus TaxID=570012 RepID=UPI0018EB0C19|nr:hypothetical protein [Shimwellia pseudoproteus]MBJ3815388.1 hypothetical protein [Shimwellia pseudoproteus]